MTHELANLKDLTEQKLTQAIADATDLQIAQKNEVLEHLSYLAAQAVLPKAQRQNSIGKSIIHGLERLLAASSNLVSLWSAIKPMLEKLF
jgi:hypothetical protein